MKQMLMLLLLILFVQKAVATYPPVSYEQFHACHPLSQAISHIGGGLIRDPNCSCTPHPVLLDDIMGLNIVCEEPLKFQAETINSLGIETKASMEFGWTDPNCDVVDCNIWIKQLRADVYVTELSPQTGCHVKTVFVGKTPIDCFIGWEGGEWIYSGNAKIPEYFVNLCTFVTGSCYQGGAIVMTATQRLGPDNRQNFPDINIIAGEYTADSNDRFWDYFLEYTDHWLWHIEDFPGPNNIPGNRLIETLKFYELL